MHRPMMGLWPGSMNTLPKKHLRDQSGSIREPSTHERGTVVPYQTIDSFEAATFDIFRKDRLALESPLNVDDCRNVIACRTLPEFSWANWLFKSGRRGQHLFTGAVTPAGFRIRKAIDYSNSGQPVVSGVFVPLPHGTRIELEISLSRWLRGFSIFAMAFSAFIGLGLVASVGAEMLDGGPNAWLVAGAIGLVAVAALLPPVLILLVAALLKKIAAGEAEFVITTLVDLLDVDTNQVTSREHQQA